MLDDRFWSKVDRLDPSGCWVWTANKNNKGYGLFRPGGKAPKRLAHRLAFEDRFEPIPFGLVICHTCDNPSCVNPDHLFLGTRKDNYVDMVNKGRRRIVVNPTNKPPVLRGESHGRAKLTEADVLSIRSRVANGEGVKSLAREFCVHHKTIRRACDGRAWRCLQPERP